MASKTTIQFRQYWSAGYPYNSGDVVFYRDGYYICRAAHLSSMEYSPLNSRYTIWMNFNGTSTYYCDYCNICSKNTNTPCIPRPPGTPVPPVIDSARFDPSTIDYTKGQYTLPGINPKNLGNELAYSNCYMIPIKGFYSSTDNYLIGDLVLFGDNYLPFVCMKPNSNIAPGTDKNYWIPFKSNLTRNCSLCLTCSTTSSMPCSQKGTNQNSGVSSGNPAPTQTTTPINRFDMLVKTPNLSPFPEDYSSFPPVAEKHVNGIYDNTCYQFIGIGSTLTITDPNVKSLQISNNLCFSISGLSITANKHGSCSLIINFVDNTYRLFGLYTDTYIYDTNRLYVGSNVLNTRQNDILYTTLNPGYTDADCYNFIRNTSRLGAFSCFLYNSVSTNDLTDPVFVKNYFVKLNSFLDLINQEVSKRNSYVILEQNLLTNLTSKYKSLVPSAIKVDMSLVSSLNILELTGAPTSVNDISGFIQCVNTNIYKKAPQLKFCWGLSVACGIFDLPQFVNGLSQTTNTIGYDTGISSILTQSTGVSKFYKSCGINLYTNLISFDRSDNIGKTQYYWNNDCYMNYIYYIQNMASILNCKVILNSLPSSTTEKTYSFIFGDIMNMVSPLLDYYKIDNWHNISVSNNAIIFPDHTDHCLSYSIMAILFDNSSNIDNVSKVSSYLTKKLS